MECWWLIDWSNLIKMPLFRLESYVPISNEQSSIRKKANSVQSSRSKCSHAQNWFVFGFIKFPEKGNIWFENQKKQQLALRDEQRTIENLTHSHGRKNHEKWLENHCSFDLTIKKSQSNWQQHSVLTEAQTNIKTVRRKSKHEKKRGDKKTNSNSNRIYRGRKCK